MALVPHPKLLTRLTNLVSKILITHFGAIGFYEPSRGGGGNRPQAPCPLFYELSRGGGGNRPQAPCPLFYELSRGGGGNRPQAPCPSLRKDGKFPPNRVGQQPLTLIWGNTECCKLFNLYVRLQCSIYIWMLLVRGSLNSVFAQSCQQGFIGMSGLWSFKNFISGILQSGIVFAWYSKIFLWPFMIRKYVCV